MKQGKITVAGIGTGATDTITPAVSRAIAEADVVIGYDYYIPFVAPLLKAGALCVDTGMRAEVERAEQAFDHAEAGSEVVVISSGDAGIYGMASLVWEIKARRESPTRVEVLPGISAFQAAAALLGAPVSHDFCAVSLSDLMTPWPLIERRVEAAATADFVTAVYNPRSEGRYWQLHRLKEIFLKHRSPETPVGVVRQAGREGEQAWVTTLAAFDPQTVDMFCTVLIGNSQSYVYDGAIVTPRGYYRERDAEKHGAGRAIMIESFRTILGELRRADFPPDHRWALLHAIHTTADFEMEELLYSDPGAVEALYEKVRNGGIKTIVTDVTMAAAGIRRGALERLGVEVECFLNDPRAARMAAEQNITRAQAGIRLAVAESPDALYVFGNAPTALIELCRLARRGEASPAGIVAAPVGFVNVREAKHRVKTLTDVPKLIVEGRKGGSNLAATLVNAILSFDDAESLKPGRDV